MDHLERIVFMKKNSTILIYLLFFVSSSLFADLISVSDNLPLIFSTVRLEIDSNTQPAQIIDPPTSVVNYYPDIETMLGFNEKQNVNLLTPLKVDGNTLIDSGTVVSSHIIFLTIAKEKGSYLYHPDVQWEFDNTILGVMSDAYGSLIFQSNPILGAEGTEYYGSDLLTSTYGLERTDLYSIDDNILSTSLVTVRSGLGDWMRVITLGDINAIPEPTTLLLLFFCLPLLTLTKKKNR